MSARTIRMSDQYAYAKCECCSMSSCSVHVPMRVKHELMSELRYVIGFLALIEYVFTMSSLGENAPSLSAATCEHLD